jgi:hypothetical protein
VSSRLLIGTLSPSRPPNVQECHTLHTFLPLSSPCVIQARDILRRRHYDFQGFSVSLLPSSGAEIAVHDDTEKSNNEHRARERTMERSGADPQHRAVKRWRGCYAHMWRASEEQEGEVAPATHRHLGHGRDDQLAAPQVEAEMPSPSGARLASQYPRLAACDRGRKTAWCVLPSTPSGEGLSQHEERIKKTDTCPTHPLYLSSSGLRG